jgi:hypothetical protein
MLLAAGTRKAQNRRSIPLHCMFVNGRSLLCNAQSLDWDGRANLKVLEPYRTHVRYSS